MCGLSINNRGTVYSAVIRYIKEQIASAKLEPGQEIPSRRELASRLKVNSNTVQRAYKIMEEEGLIYTERNRRSKITKDEKILGSVREELILQAVSSFVSSIRSINVPVDEVLDLVNKNYM
ncbi:GntR family transcriptional regulator [Virgibacillus sp. SK37]|uniref:GntR family transcriptional regulator n=1 Tax=Virgibacillus sp. SK37 TaxID=403957 RepID=UPI0005956231|nr:GntR family transcriptional regulator [Virgibacillus sp. SK37]